MDNTNIEMVEHELAKAREKHPHFADRALYCSNTFIQYALGMARINSRYEEQSHSLSIEAIEEEEFFEALEAMVNGDWVAAKTEWAQVAAVAIRAMDFCDMQQLIDATK